MKDVEKILKQQCNNGTVPIMLKKWTPLLYVDSEKLDTIPVWVCLSGLSLEFENMDSLRDLGNSLGFFRGRPLISKYSKVISGMYSHLFEHEDRPLGASKYYFGLHYQEIDLSL